MTPESATRVRSELILRDVLSEIFQGRSFQHEGAVLSPQRAFSGDGFLPLFAARAAKRFRTLHGNGIRLNRCLSCGLDRPQESGCGEPCPLKQGIRVLGFPFNFELSPDGLLGVKVTFTPYRPALMVALFMIQDVAIEVLQLSKNPRMIPVTTLFNDLAAEIAPLFQPAPEVVAPQPPVAERRIAAAQTSGTLPLDPVPPRDETPAGVEPRREPAAETLRSQDVTEISFDLDAIAEPDPLLHDFEAMLHSLEQSPR